MKGDETLLKVEGQGIPFFWTNTYYHLLLSYTLELAIFFTIYYIFPSCPIPLPQEVIDWINFKTLSQEAYHEHGK